MAGRAISRAAGAAGLHARQACAAPGRIVAEGFTTLRQALCNVYAEERSVAGMARRGAAETGSKAGSSARAGGVHAPLHRSFPVSRFLTPAFAALLACAAVPAAAQSMLPDLAALTPEQVRAIDAGEPFGDDAVAIKAGLPSPSWALEHAEEIGLAPDQVRDITALHDEMVEEAVKIGPRLLELEAELEKQFRTGRVRPGGMKKLVSEIATIEGDLRAIHLEAHLGMRALLTRDQLDAFAKSTAVGG